MHSSEPTFLSTMVLLFYYFNKLSTSMTREMNYRWNWGGHICFWNSNYNQNCALIVNRNYSDTCKTQQGPIQSSSVQQSFRTHKAHINVLWPQQESRTVISGLEPEDCFQLCQVWHLLKRADSYLCFTLSDCSNRQKYRGEGTGLCTKWCSRKESLNKKKCILPRNSAIK